MRRVTVVWRTAVLDSSVYKCEAAVYSADSRNLLLRKVYSQDPGSMALLADTKLIPLDRVASVNESQW